MIAVSPESLAKLRKYRLNGPVTLIAGGNYGHAGRPGQRGGSAPKGAAKPVEPFDVRTKDTDYFRARELAKSEGMKLMGNWFHSLSREELEAISHYRDNSYIDINSALRSSPSAVQKLSPDLQGEVKLLDSALVKSSIPEPVAVYRGFSNNQSLIANLKPGDSFTDNGFVSTTLHYQFAVTGFSDRRDPQGATIARIELPKGFHAGYVSGTEITQAEQEMLLPHGTTFKVKSVEQVKLDGPPFTPVKIVNMVPVASSQSASRFIAGKRRKNADKYLWSDDDVEIHRNVEAFSPDEARDDHGRWTQGGFGLVSPNEEENLDFDKAVAKLGSEGQTKLLQLGENIGKQIGVNLTQQSAIGDWSDGAENSIFQKYTGAEAEDIKYAASLMGDAANQKAVIAFSPSAEGKDRFYQFSLNMDAKAARKALDDAGIQFRTLIPDAGTTKVAVFDPGGELSDKIGAVSEKYNAVIDQKRGTGEFIGADSREEAHNVYHQVIQQYESSHSRHYRRLAAAARELRNSRRRQKEIASGGPGSGCHGPNCGRPAGLIKLPGSLGITRGKMPQIKSAYRNHYLEWLRKQGIGHTKETVAPETLRPTQKNINPTSMAKLHQGGGEGAALTKVKPMIISRDNYIMDGHHRWHDAIGSDEKLNVIRIDAPMKKLLRITDSYPHAEYRSSKGLPIAAYSEDEARDDSGKWTSDTSATPWKMSREQYYQTHTKVEPGYSIPEEGNRINELPPDTPLWVWHMTDDKATAEGFAKNGIDPDEKPGNYARYSYESGKDAEYAPGRGLSGGLYVGATPQSVSGYGRHLVAVRVRRSDLGVSPEQENLGTPNGGHALAADDAVINKKIPASDVIYLGRYDRYPKDAHTEFKEYAKRNGIQAAFLRISDMRKLGKQVLQEMKAGKRCPRCGSKKYGLMPTDFETAKCSDCGKTWEVQAYSPDQPRDDSGRWTDGGGTGPVTKMYGKYAKAYPSVRNKITAIASKYGKVEARLKTMDSLKGKLANGVPLKKVGDIMGFRVTTTDVKSVYNAVEKIKGELKGTGIDIRQVSDKIQTPRDGYRAVHLDLLINGMRAELQVRTQNQSKWADWAHDLIYKGRLHGNPEAQRYASKVSDALYKMDRGKQANMPPCPPVIKPNCFSLSP